jgi:two-component system sensor histidine kinase BaeS
VIRPIRRGSFPPLRRRLFVATAFIVVLSIGIAFGVGLILTRSAVETANLDGLTRQAELIKNQEEAGICPFCKLSKLSSFLAQQHERIELFELSGSTPFLPDSQRLKLRRTDSVNGTVIVDGTRYLDAAGSIKGRPGKGFVLLRPASLKAAGWGPFLRALLIAGAIGGALAALGSLLLARWIARPVRQVAEASRSLAEGVSPEPVPLEGSAELALLAQSFNHMADQLHRAREAERNFLLSVSHELKTPLAAVRGYAEGLEEGIFTAGEAASTIREEARRLERLVRDLLDLARMNRREFVVHQERVDLSAIAQDVVRRYASDARAAEVALEAAGESPAAAVADPDRVLQVVSNLVENALRSTPAGGSVWVRAEPGVLTVEDTGVGLAAEDLPYAFERFYLHDRNPDGRRRIGSGLGLAVVKELTERMGGSVSVESELGRGTTFTVRLPTARVGSRRDEPVALPTS